MEYPTAWGEPPASAELKWAPEDFEVLEQLDIQPDGEGEHLWLWLEKRGRNTADVARELAALAGVPARAVSWSGLKDRQALTRQWLSIQLPRRDDAATWSGDGWTVLSAARHSRKLRIGTHRSNRFRLRLRRVVAQRDPVEQRLALLRDRGVPNYFGEQRFGWQRRNIDAARTWFATGMPRIDRQRRSLLLSAARSELFNQVLAGRVADGSWQRILDGEVLILDGRGSVFHADGDPALPARLAAGELHATGPLCGVPAGLSPTGEAARLEQTLLDGTQTLREGLVAAGVQAARRSLRLLPRQFGWQWRGDDLELDFILPAGCFATVLVRELSRPASPEPESGAVGAG